MSSAPEATSIYDELQSLIRQTEKTEIECGKYLKYTPNIIFRNDTIIDYNSILYPGYRGSLGISDYVVAAKVCADGGYDCFRAYIWELKAPQCHIFQEDPRSERRVMPSLELVTAENQLLHYYYEYVNSGIFREDFEEINQQEIKIGGIIIGSNKTKVRRGKKLSKFSETEVERLYKRACRVRVDNFYIGCRMRLLTWDDVLLQLKQYEYDQRYAGDKSMVFEPIALKDTPIETE
jgi:hypothetical protein